jgi:hypothetical protein
MASKFAFGDKFDQAFSNHAEGTIVAVLRIVQGSPDTPLKCSVTARYRSQAKPV